VVSGLVRVRERARQQKKERFTALLHHVDVDLLRAAFSWLERDAAPGVDGLTWRQYEQWEWEAPLKGERLVVEKARANSPDVLPAVLPSRRAN
jgi:hypothetical protein